MSIRDFLNNNGEFYYPKITSGQLKTNNSFQVGNITQNYDPINGYSFKDQALNTLLSFDLNSNLTSCSAKNYIDTQNSSQNTNITSLQNIQTTHAGILTTLQSTTTSLQSSLQTISGETITGNLTANNNQNIASYVVNNNSIMFLTGKLLTDYSVLQFKYIIKNNNGSLTNISDFYEGYLYSSDSLTFDYSSNTINLYFNSVNNSPFTIIINSNDQNL